MSRKLMMDKFCIEYGWIPKAPEMEHFRQFCDEIKFDEILKKVLEPENHPKTESGRVLRPNIATLRYLSQQFIQEAAQTRQRDEMATVEGDECFYCTAGYVMEIYESKGVSFSRVKGRCRCRRGDYTGPLSKRTPVEPSQEVQDYARKEKMICARVVDEMVRVRSQANIPPERLEKNRKIKGKGKSIGETLPDDYTLEDPEIPF